MVKCIFCATKSAGKNLVCSSFPESRWTNPEVICCNFFPGARRISANTAIRFYCTPPSVVPVQKSARSYHLCDLHKAPCSRCRVALTDHYSAMLKSNRICSSIQANSSRIILTGVCHIKYIISKSIRYPAMEYDSSSLFSGDFLNGMLPSRISGTLESVLGRDGGRIRFNENR